MSRGNLTNFWDPIFWGLNFLDNFFLLIKVHLTRATRGSDKSLDLLNYGRTNCFIWFTYINHNSQRQILSKRWLLFNTTSAPNWNFSSFPVTVSSCVGRQWNALVSWLVMHPLAGKLYNISLLCTIYTFCWRG